MLVRRTYLSPPSSDSALFGFVPRCDSIISHIRTFVNALCSFL
nr:MAG TPA: hypothetical protein [Caudoviricetes sp.]